jgi:hypothetical protein
MITLNCEAEPALSLLSRRRRLSPGRRASASGPAWAALASALATALLSGGFAAAQAPPGAGSRAQESRGALSRADELFRKGNQLYIDKKWEEAEAAFEAAWALQKTFDIAANLGHTELRLKKPREAAEHLTLALETWPLVVKESQRELAKQALQEARAQVGALKIRVNVRGAVISVDGQRVGESPLASELFVTPDKHKVQATLAGYDPEAVTVSVAKGASGEALLTLRRGDAPGSGVNAGVVIGGAAITLVSAGVGLGFTIASQRSLASGEEMRGSIASRLQRNDPTVCKANPPPEGCDDLYDAIEDSDRFRNIAVGAFVVGGAAALGTAVYALWPRSKIEQRTGVQVRPTVSSSDGGLSVRGNF